MSAALHLVNGDAAAERLRAVLGPRAAILPWRDMLHDAPVPAGLSAGEFAAVRAAYLAGCSYGSPQAILAGFRARDAALAALPQHAAVTLWLEPDLHDQLQLVQILALASAGWLPRAGLRLAQAGDDLATLDPGSLAALGAGAAPVADAQLALAARAWAAFTAATPEAVAALAASDTRALPFLGTALARLLEELPGPRDGLARTERWVLATLAGGEASPSRLFRRFRDEETPRWLGDLPFFRRLDALAAPPLALVEGEAAGRARAALHAPLRIGPRGAEVAAGFADRARMAPLDRWWGGTWLGVAPVWRWDAAARTLARA